MIDAIAAEIRLREGYLKSVSGKPVIDTIYFGGGTPSLLQDAHFEKIFIAIHEMYSVAPGAEITVEANPDDLSIEKLRMLKNRNINRLSIGVQSFYNDDLQVMNRAHTAEMAVTSVEAAARAGFQNITIDLMYGLPGMDSEKWKHNLAKAFALPVQHLSCYCLTVEKKTALEKMIREGRVLQPEDTEAAAQFSILMEKADRHGFDHYEISNFGKPGYYSRHNCSYWNDTPYVGIGPSAHSYDGKSRQWNIASNAAYVLSIQKGELPAQAELLTPENRYNEYIMTGLRTQWGVSTEVIENGFGASFKTDFLVQITPYIESEMVVAKDSVYTLSRKGKLMADRITAAIFVA